MRGVSQTIIRRCPNSAGKPEAAQMLRELSEPWASGERVKRVIERTAKAVGLGYWRASDIWYGKARRIEPREIEQIEQALRGKNERAARNELQELKTRLAILEARICAGDADLYRPVADPDGEQMWPLR
jgi:hypothetical protein